MSTVDEQSERNALVILNLTCFPIGTYLCAGRRIPPQCADSNTEDR